MLILALVLFFAAEALLGLRVWLQLTSQRTQGELDAGLLMLLSERLAEPFSRVTQQAPLDRTGVVDFTTLVAMEGYLLILLGLIVLWYVARRLVAAVRRYLALSGRRRRGLEGRRLLRKLRPAGRAFEFYVDYRAAAGAGQPAAFRAGRNGRQAS
jgi:hypothetical protein